MNTIIIDNFLSKKECNLLIKFYTDNDNKNIKKYRNTSILDLAYLGDNKFERKLFNFVEPYNSIINDVVNRVTCLCIQNKNKNDTINFYSAQIVKWPSFSYQKIHKDRPNTKFSAILYLNDKYLGGNTIVEGKKIKKKTGRLLIIKNSDTVLHKVQKILFGTRYTFPIWYANQQYFQ